MELNPPVALRYDLYRRTGAELSPKEPLTHSTEIARHGSPAHRPGLAARPTFRASNFSTGLLTYDGPRAFGLVTKR